MKILYAATDTIAVPLLEALNKEGLIKAVFTSPDKPGKRGKTLVPSPIKVKAMELGLDVYTPETLRTEARALVGSLGVDTLLSFCYGKIFGPKFLSMFDKTFNVHPSALPKYRGCAPIYATILNQDKESSISIQKIALGVDEGDIYAQLPFCLDGTETNASLEDKVSNLASGFVVDVLTHLDEHPAKPQSGDPSYQMFISKEDGMLDFTKDARTLHAQIRACNPWPRAFVSTTNGNLIFTGVHGSVFDEIEPTEGEKPGTVVSLDKMKGLRIATANGYLYVDKILPPMKKEMDANSFVNGNKWIIGTVLGDGYEKN